MAKYRDFRINDVVTLIPKGFETDERLKIIKLAQRINDSPYLKEFLLNHLLVDCKMTVNKISRTKKTDTEYALVRLNRVDFAVQTRYLKLVDRKAKHPATRIFL